MKKILIAVLALAVLAGAYFGFLRKRFSPAPAVSPPAGGEQAGKPGDDDVKKKQEKIAAQLAEQAAIQRQVQQTSQRSVEDVQRTLKVVDEINRINRQNQQLQQQNRP